MSKSDHAINAKPDTEEIIVGDNKVSVSDSQQYDSNYVKKSDGLNSELILTSREFKVLGILTDNAKTEDLISTDVEPPHINDKENNTKLGLRKIPETEKITNERIGNSVEPDFEINEIKTKSSFGNKYSTFIKRRVFWVPVVPLILLSGFAVFCSVYFFNHTLPGSTVAGLSVSLKNRGEISKLIEQKINELSIEVKTNEENLKPSLEDIGVIIDSSTTVNCLFKHNESMISRMKIWRKNNCQLVYSVDKAKQENYFLNITQTIDRPSQDATIIIDNGKAVINQEILARVSGFPNASEKINTSVESLSDIDLQIELYEDLPQILSADLEDSKKHIDSIIDTPVTLSIQGNILRPNKEQVAGWLSLSQEKQSKKVSVNIDNLKVSAYIDGAVKPFIKPPRSRVILKNPDGTQRELNPGEDGVDVTEKQQVAALIVSQLSKYQPTKIDLKVDFAPRNTITAGDYDKWLEADLTTKRLYAYEKDVLVATFLASAGAPETPTVVGEFKIQTKVRKQTMRGSNTDGTLYNVPNVEFVSYFYKDYAIHGNYWRPTSVFGNQNTSHGCVGLVNNDASWVYDWASVGTTIITHY